MRRWVWRLGAVVLLVAVVWVIRVTVLAPDPISVRVETVERGRVEETVTNSQAGTVKARRRARLSPEIGGTVVALPFREGDRVRTGQVVLELDAGLHKARLGLATKELETAQAQSHQTCLAAERAAREHQRMRRLATDQIISVDLLDQFENAAQTSQAACDAARAGVARAGSAVELARVELAKTVLRAPFDAVVAEVSIELGEWTTPSPPALPVPPVLDLLDPTSVYVSAPMDEVDSARIAPAMAVRVTVDSHRGRSLAGSVSRVAPYVLDLEAQNRTVEIDVELDDRAFAATLLPGTSADVEVILQVRDNVVRIPTAALFEGTRVLIVGDDGRLQERPVEVGLSNWNFAEITSGLVPGSQVVVSLDRPEIRPGALVSVEDAAGEQRRP